MMQKKSLLQCDLALSLRSTLSWGGGGGGLRKRGKTKEAPHNFA